MEYSSAPHTRESMLGFAVVDLTPNKCAQILRDRGTRYRTVVRDARSSMNSAASHR